MFTQQKVFAEKEKSKTIEVIACVVIIMQLLIIDFLCFRAMLINPETFGFVWTAIFVLMTIASCFYFLRFILKEVDLEKNVLFSYLFLNYYFILLVLFSLLNIFIFALFYFITMKPILTRPLIFSVVWLISTSIIILGIWRRLKILKNTEMYQIINNRVGKGPLRIGKSRYSPGRRMKLADLPLVFVMLTLLLVIGIVIIVIGILDLILEPFTTSVFIPLLFGLVFIVIPLMWLKGLLDAIRGKVKTPVGEVQKSVIPSHISELVKPIPFLIIGLGAIAFCILKLIYEPFHPSFIVGTAVGIGFAVVAIWHLIEAIREKHIKEKTEVSTPANVYNELFILSVLLFVLTVFSLMSLLNKGTWSFICALIPAILVFRVVEFTEDRLEGEKKKKKTRLEPSKKIQKLQRGIIKIGYIFIYILLFGGLAILYYTKGPLIAFEEKIIINRLLIMWGVLILYIFGSFHRTTGKKYYTLEEREPFLFQFTEIITKPFWNIRIKLFGQPKLEQVSVTEKTAISLSLLDAKTLADNFIAERDPKAYPFALCSGYEGISLKDYSSEEWRFFYYLPSKNREIEVDVIEKKIKAKRSKLLYTPPEKIPIDKIELSTVVNKVIEVLSETFTEPQETGLNLYIYLPASRFVEEVEVEEMPPTEKTYWLIIAFDEDMEFRKEFYIEIEQV